MTILSTNPWETETLSGLVSLPLPYTHKLHVSTSGPPRKSPKQPVIILFTGGGVPCAFYVGVQKALGEKYRVYFYDRAGYDRSEIAPRDDDDDREHVEPANEISRNGDIDSSLREAMLGYESNFSQAKNGEACVKDGNWEGIVMAHDTALELRALLLSINVRGPYVLLAHSYGGILAREFLALMNDPSSTSPSPSPGPTTEEHDKVVGLALIETGSELLYHTYQPSIPPPSFTSLLEGVEIDTHLKEESGLSDAEWEEGLRAIERTTPGAHLEDNRGSARLLALEKQIPKRAMKGFPVAVLKANWEKDWKMLYEEGVKRGNGSEEERREARGFLEDLEFFDWEVKRGQLGLTGKGGKEGRWREVRDCGHDVAVRRPELVMEEVGWCMEVLKGMGWK